MANYQYLFLTGSNPALSVAEIYSFFTRIKAPVTYDYSIFPSAIGISSSQALDTTHIISQLGGVPIIARIGKVLPKNTPSPSLLNAIHKSISVSPNKKYTIGISWITKKQNFIKDTHRIGMDLKRILKNDGAKTRIILPRNGTALSTAQLFHAKIPEQGTAVLLLRDSKENIVIGIVEAIQDIQSYAIRDRERPAVDPGTGMTPPKLAQILINLSLVHPGATLYDPFCGSGTIVMEALRMGNTAVGSDRSPKQVERSRKNLLWFANRFDIDTKLYKIFCHNIDVTFPLKSNSVSAVATEGWLGPTSTAYLSKDTIPTTFKRVQRILHMTLKNLYPVLLPNAYVVICIPAFRLPHSSNIIRAPFLTKYPGYAPFIPRGWNVSPLLAHNMPQVKKRQGTLLYGRKDAIVMREIIRIRRDAGQI